MPYSTIAVIGGEIDSLLWHPTFMFWSGLPHVTLQPIRTRAVKECINYFGETITFNFCNRLRNWYFIPLASGLLLNENLIAGYRFHLPRTIAEIAKTNIEIECILS